MSATTTHLRICPLCEATCGLELTLDGNQVTEVRGDDADVFSHGYLCPKGVALAELHHDPDRLTTPLVREPGETAHREATWPEALSLADRLLGNVWAEGDRNAVGIYVGNPSVHSLDGSLYAPALIKSLGTRNVYSASTVDQMPKHVVGGLLYGDKLSIAVPDIDRTDLFVCMGADPMSSNGSLWTVPDVPGRIRALKARGGKMVVVDPRRSRTAQAATTHLAIRPGTDALLLAAVASHLLGSGRVRLRDLEGVVSGVDVLRDALAPFTPEAVAPHCDLGVEEITGLAEDLWAADRAVVYGRIGTQTTAFGTLAGWLVDVVNAITGNLDRPGGSMFPLAPAGQRNAPAVGQGRGVRFGRFASRVRGIGEVFGELPSAVLAEEIATPGEGQIRGLVTVAGNPARSLPDGRRLEEGLAGLEAMVSVDCYLNETTRHAHVILPVPSPLARGHWDLAFTQLAHRNAARYSPPTVAMPEEMRPEWRTLLALVGIATGQGPDADVDALDDLVAATVASQQVTAPGSPVSGHEADELLAAVGDRRGPERLLDLLIRTGPYGDHLGNDPDGLTLDTVMADPHGIDLGPMRPRLPGMLRTPSGTVELAHETLVADLVRLEAQLGVERNGALVLVGRRHLRSNNSWMHNLPLLAGGTNRCTLHVHPDDADRLGLDEGGRARVASAVGEVVAEVEVTDRIRPGVVSLPHGWGHDAPGAALSVAAKDPGVASNVLTDPSCIDPLSNNAQLNAIPVEVSPTS